MVTRVLGSVLLAMFALGWSVSGAEAQPARTLFQFQNRKSHGCIRVEAVPATAIVAGFLRTFGCSKAPDELIDVGNDAPARLTFDLGNGIVKCAHVRAMDVKTLPSDIFANACGEGTSRWALGGTDAQGFGEIRLFSNPAGADELCLSEDTRRRTVVIDRCSDAADATQQRWKRVPILPPP